MFIKIIDHLIMKAEKQCIAYTLNPEKSEDNGGNQ